MTKEVVDRRVQKTRQLLQDALVDLISEKGFEAVTIQDILDRANVGRSTFYIHYENKNELLHSCFRNFNQLFEQYKEAVSNSRKSPKELIGTDFTLNLFRFVDQNRRLFKALLEKDSIAMLHHPVYNYFLTYIDEALKKQNSSRKKTSEELEMLANYIASAFIGTLKWWLDKKVPMSVEEVDQSFKSFAAHDVAEVLGLPTFRQYQ